MQKETIELLQDKARFFIKTKQYSKVLLINNIIKDLELNDKVFMEGEFLLLD